MSTTNMGSEGFKWFLGVVEDLADPLKLGRVRVRIFQEHDVGIDTKDLPWAIAMMPITSASSKGKGTSPTGITIGSYVHGFYIDGAEKQFPAITHTWHTIPQMDDALHGVSARARGKSIPPDQLEGPEPPKAYAATYPHNKVIETAGGHVIEIDDTPTEERLHILHKSGSYVEINKEGRMVTKIVGDGYHIVIQDQNVFVKGECNIRVDGDVNLVAGGNTQIVSEGDTSIISGGRLSLQGKSGVDIKSGTDIAASAPGGVAVTSGSLAVVGAISSGVGVTGAFTTPTGKTVHVTKGIVSNIF